MDSALIGEPRDENRDAKQVGIETLPVHQRCLSHERGGLKKRNSSGGLGDLVRRGFAIQRQLSESYGTVDVEDGRQRTRLQIVVERLYLDKRAFVVFYVVALLCLYGVVFVYPNLDTSASSSSLSSFSSSSSLSSSLSWEVPPMALRTLEENNDERLREAAPAVVPSERGGGDPGPAMMDLARRVIEQMRRDDHQCLTARHAGFDYDLLVLWHRLEPDAVPIVMWNMEVVETYGAEVERKERASLWGPTISVKRPAGVVVRYMQWDFSPGIPEPISLRSYRSRDAHETRCLLHCHDLNSGRRAAMIANSV